MNYRPVHSDNFLFQNHPHWRDLILFYEYFNGKNGAGLGANHQTGWTGLIASLIHQQTQTSEQSAIALDLLPLSASR